MVFGGLGGVWECLGTSWGHLGGLGRLGASWERLVAPWGVLGASWTRFWASWKRLVRPWDVLWALFGVLWISGCLGCDGFKFVRPKVAKLGSILGSFGIDFWGRELEFSIIFGLFWA